MRQPGKLLGDVGTILHILARLVPCSCRATASSASATKNEKCRAISKSLCRREIGVHSNDLIYGEPSFEVSFFAKFSRWRSLSQAHHRK
jgi:hypothetical protein